MKRLYILTLLNIKCSSPAVQAGHAIAEWMLKSKETQEWKNGHLIYLSLNTSLDLFKWKNKLIDGGYSFITFKEPDLDNQETAIACLTDEKIFKNLKLLK